MGRYYPPEKVRELGRQIVVDLSVSHKLENFIIRSTDDFVVMGYNGAWWFALIAETQTQLDQVYERYIAGSLVEIDYYIVSKEALKK
jgi:hypothetical protein